MTNGKLAITLGVLLFLSLAGNLLMAGYVIGQKAGDVPEKMTEKDNRRSDWKKRDELLRQKLSPADLKIFEEAREQNRPRIESLKQALEKTRENVLTAQNADPFEAQGLDDAMQAEAAQKTVFLKAIREMRKGIFAQLSPEGRKEMRKLHSHGGERRGEKRREKMRDRMDGNDRPPLRERRFRANPRPAPQEDRLVPPQEPPPPAHDDGDNYGEQPAPPPPEEDCGGCEVPSDGSPLFLQPEP